MGNLLKSLGKPGVLKADSTDLPTGIILLKQSVKPWGGQSPLTWWAKSIRNGRNVSKFVHQSPYHPGIGRFTPHEWLISIINVWILPYMEHLGQVRFLVYIYTKTLNLEAAGRASGGWIPLTPSVKTLSPPCFQDGLFPESRHWPVGNWPVGNFNIFWIMKSCWKLIRILY